MDATKHWNEKLRSEKVSSKKARSEKVRSEKVRSEKVRSEKDRSEKVRSEKSSIWALVARWVNVAIILTNTQVKGSNLGASILKFGPFQFSK